MSNIIIITFYHNCKYYMKIIHHFNSKFFYNGFILPRSFFFFCLFFKEECDGMCDLKEKQQYESKLILEYCSRVSEYCVSIHMPITFASAYLHIKFLNIQSQILNIVLILMFDHGLILLPVNAVTQL